MHIHQYLSLYHCIGHRPTRSVHSTFCSSCCQSCVQCSCTDTNIDAFKRNVNMYLDILSGAVQRGGVGGGAPPPVKIRLPCAPPPMKFMIKHNLPLVRGGSLWQYTVGPCPQLQLWPPHWPPKCKPQNRHCILYYAVCLCLIITIMGVRRIFSRGGQIRGLGKKVPSGVQGRSLCGGLGAKPRKADDRL